MCLSTHRDTKCAKVSKKKFFLEMEYSTIEENANIKGYVRTRVCGTQLFQILLAPSSETCEQ